MKREKILNIKIVFSFFIMIIVVCSMIVIVLHEKQQLKKIKINTTDNRYIQHNINTAHRFITQLATLGESIVNWKNIDYQTYHKRRLCVDSLLQNLQQDCCEFIYPTHFDTLRSLLASKELYLFHIMQIFRKQEEADSILVHCLPLVARQVTRPREIIRKKKGIAGWLGKKETIQTTISVEPFHLLNKQLIEMQEERSHNLDSYMDTLRMKNIKLNNELMKIISEMDNLTQIAFLQKEQRIEDMRQNSFRLMLYVLTVAIVLLVISYLIIQRDLRQKEQSRWILEESIRQNKALLDMRKKIILTISHDIRGPLNGINGSAELAMNTRDKKKRNSYLENVCISCQHILHLVNNLLDIYRMNESKESRNDVLFRIGQLIERVTARYSRTSNDKGLLFTIQLSGVDITVNGDADRIEQILDNLLTNAIKFTKVGEICLIAIYENGQLAMEVRDTGVGMNEETLSRIFAPFERAAQEVNSQGFGLGLSITKGLVSLLDGEITVESTVGKGSTFRVTLPLAQTLEIEKKDSCIIRNVTRLPRQVLVVDDDSVQLEVIKEMLERNGVSCETCSNAKEVIQALRKQDFDLILTDVQMPGMDGFNLLKLLRNSNIGNSRTVPVMVMTARGDHDASGFAAAGFLACIHKPFSTQELLSFISSSVSEPDTDESSFGIFKTLTFEVSDKHKVLKLFVEETERNIAELKDALKRENRKQLCEVVHRMLPVWDLLQISEVLQIYRQLLHDKKVDMDKLREETGKIIAYAHGLIVEAKNEITGAGYETENTDS